MTFDIDDFQGVGAISEGRVYLYTDESPVIDGHNESNDTGPLERDAWPLMGVFHEGSINDDSKGNAKLVLSFKITWNRP